MVVIMMLSSRKIHIQKKKKTSLSKLNTSTVFNSHIHLPRPWEHHVTHSSVASSGVLLHQNPERSSSCPLQPVVPSVLWLRRWTLSPPEAIWINIMLMRLSVQYLPILGKWAYVTIMNIHEHHNWICSNNARPQSHDCWLWASVRFDPCLTLSGFCRTWQKRGDLSSWWPHLAT